MTRTSFLLISVPILAADPVSGRWRIDMLLSTGERKPAFLDLRLSGSTISGVWNGLLGEKAAIRGGSWEAPRIRFEFPWMGDHPGVICKVTGELKDGRLHLELNGDRWTRKEIATRAQ